MNVVAAWLLVMSAMQVVRIVCQDFIQFGKYERKSNAAIESGQLNLHKYAKKIYILA